MRSASFPHFPFSLRRPAALAAPLLLPLLVVPGGCGAMPMQDQVLTQWGQDLLAAGRAPTVAEELEGDVLLAGGEISFSGRAGGDYLGAGGRQVIGGSVGGSARAAGGDVELRGDVGRNATLAGGRVYVADGSRVGGNAYVAAGLVVVDGEIALHLRAAGDEVVLNGDIEGSVSVDARTLRVGPSARIGGDLLYRVPEGGTSIDPEAQIAGERAQLAARTPPRFPAFPGWRWGLRAFWIASFLLAGVVLTLLFPGGMGSASEGLRRRPAAAAGLGFLWILLVPLAGLVAALTLIGLPLAFILGALFAISLYVARVVPALWLGRLLLGLQGRRMSDGEEVGRGALRGALVVAFLLGGILLAIAEVLPFVGPVVALLATLFGLGALLLGLRGTDRSLRRAAETGPEPEPGF